jgi:hypothetical protein
MLWVALTLLFVLGAALWSVGGSGGGAMQRSTPADILADEERPSTSLVPLPPTAHRATEPSAAVHDAASPQEPTSPGASQRATPAPRLRPPLPAAADLEQLAGVAGAVAMLERAHAAQTAAQLRRLFTLTQLYLTEQGRPPERLEDLDAVERLPPRALVDSWGNPIRLQSRGASVRLTSAGTDGAFDTADDLVLDNGSLGQRSAASHRVPPSTNAAGSRDADL